MISLFNKFYFQMMKSENWQRILAISCLILGAYIFIAYLLSSSSTIPAMHLGCFNSNHSLDHYSRLTNIVNQIQKEYATERSIAYLHQDGDYGNEVELAKRFQRYVEVAMFNRQNEHANNQLLQELTKAQKEFFACHRSIGDTYSSQDCLQEYKEYQSCGDNLAKLHEQLKNATLFRKSITQAIQRSLSQKIGHDHSDKEKIQLAHRKYQLKIQQLDKQRLSLIKQHEKLTNYRTTIKFDLTDTLKKFETAKSSLQLCSLHRQDFILCQQITAEVETLGIDSMNELNQRIQKKKELCLSLMKLVTECKTKQTLDSTRAIFNRNLEQLKDLIRLSVSNSIKSKQSKCGCQLQKEQDLRKSKQKLQTLFHSQELSLTKTQNRLMAIDSQLQTIETKRSDAQKQYQDEINNATAESQYEVVHFNTSLLIDLQNAGKRIIDLKVNYSNLQDNCKRLQQQLSVRINKIDQISSCLSKKEYFLKLKDEVTKNIQSNVNGNQFAIKEALLRTLQKIGRKEDDNTSKPKTSRIDDL